MVSRGYQVIGCMATYRLLLVAFSICSSRAVLAEDDHQLIILAFGYSDQQRGGVLRSVDQVNLNKRYQYRGV